MGHYDTEQLLRADILAGRVSRRQLLKRGAALGLSAPIVASLLAACGGGEDASGDDSGSESDSEDGGDESADENVEDSGDSGDGSSDGETPESGSEAPTERGGGGLLRLLWWQAPDIINPHLAQGTKDFDASNVVYEALAYADQEGKLTPRLAASIPSIEDGSVAEDGMSVTWTLRDDVYWHDGEQFTAEDVKFTHEFVSTEATTATTFTTYESISEVEIVDDFTVTLHFKEPTPGWYVPFVGDNGKVLPEHLFGDYIGAEARNAPYNLEPIGTGPFKVRDFRPADTVFYEINQDYWQDGKPYFDEIEMKGGGDAASAARAVIVTGEADWAWNIQVEADVLESMEQQGESGFVHAFPGTSAERIMVNFADPHTETNGAFAEPSTPHPFLTDLLVREAIGLSIQRDTVANQLYGAGGEPTANNLNAPEWVVNPDLSWTFDLEQAAAKLDEAGATDEDGDGVREYEGTRMYMLYQTSINSIRQRNQELVKGDLEQIGFEVELKSVDSAVFFSSDPGNPDTYGHFYADIEMYTNGPSTTYPVNWAQRYHSSEIAQQSNNWSGYNITRYSNPEMDELIDQMGTELDSAEQERLFQELNRIAAEDHAEIPIVYRTGVATVANNLAGYKPGPWVSDLWDVGDWYREE